MTPTSQCLLAIACLVLAGSALVAIFHPDYDDNLLQRFGLVLTGAGATVAVYQVYYHQPADRAVSLALIGAVVYCLASFLKLYITWPKKSS